MIFNAMTFNLFILCKLQGHDLTLTSWPVCVGCGWGTGLDWFEVANTGSVLFLCDPETVKKKLHYHTMKKMITYIVCCINLSTILPSINQDPL